MLKTLALMLIAVIAVTIGDIWMSQAMKGFGEVKITGVKSLWDTGVRFFTTPRVWMAISCMATFFFLWTYILSWADLTFVLPLTALTYVFNAALAPIILGERVSSVRWLGVIFITVGVAIVAFSEAVQKQQAEPPPPAELRTDSQGFENNSRNSEAI